MLLFATWEPEGEWAMRRTVGWVGSAPARWRALRESVVRGRSLAEGEDVCLDAGVKERDV